MLTWLWACSPAWEAVEILGEVDSGWIGETAEPQDDTDAGDDTDEGPTDPVDGDGDGYADELDCDDGDPEVHPGAEEVCNELDDDCDGVVDGLTTAEEHFAGFLAVHRGPLGTQDAVTFGDLDGDGRDDLVVCERGGVLAWALHPDQGAWVSEGAFRSSWSTVSAANGRTCSRVLLDDLDGDGHLDALAAESSDGSSVLLRYPGTKDGFDAPEELATTAGDPVLVVGDLDGDGWTDVAFGESLAWNDAGVMDVGLGPCGSLGLAGGAALHADGRTVLACLEGDQTGRLASGDRLFASVEHDEGCQRIASGPRRGNAGDLDGDGHADVLSLAEEGVAWCAGDGTGALALRDVLGDDIEAADGPVDRDGDGYAEVVTGAPDEVDGLVIWTGSAAGPVETSRHVWPARGLSGVRTVLADLDGDGVDELLVWSDDGSLYQYPSVEGEPQGPDAFRHSLGSGARVVVADLDGNSTQELLLFGAGLALRYVSSGGQWSNTGTLATDLVPMSLVGDVDGDGADDVVLAEDGGEGFALLSWSGTLRVGETVDNPSSASTSGLLADLDGDGDEELVIGPTDGAGATQIVAFGLGGAGLADPQDLLDATLASGVQALVAAPLGGWDGLVAANLDALRLYQIVSGLEELSSASLQPTTEARLATTLDAETTTILVHDPGSSAFLRFELDGGELQALAELTTSDGFPGELDVSLTDVDADGQLEAWAYDADSCGVRTWTEQAGDLAELDEACIAAEELVGADLDRDGYEDLVGVDAELVWVHPGVAEVETVDLCE